MSCPLAVRLLPFLLVLCLGTSMYLLSKFTILFVFSLYNDSSLKGIITAQIAWQVPQVRREVSNLMYAHAEGHPPPRSLETLFLMLNNTFQIHCMFCSTLHSRAKKTTHCKAPKQTSPRARICLALLKSGLQRPAQPLLRGDGVE